MVDRTTNYLLDDGLMLLHKLPSAKFDESVECCHSTGSRSPACRPDGAEYGRAAYGTGKTIRILVFAKGEHEKAAIDAGADFVALRISRRKFRADGSIRYRHRYTGHDENSRQARKVLVARHHAEPEIGDRNV